MSINPHHAMCGRNPNHNPTFTTPCTCKQLREVENMIISLAEQFGLFREGLRKEPAREVEQKGTPVKTTPAATKTAPPQPKKAPTVSKDEFVKVVATKYDRRTFIVDDIKEYTEKLSPENAFALSRLLPKEILDKLLFSRGTEVFADNITYYAEQIMVKGVLQEDHVKRAEEQFLASHGMEFLVQLGGVGR